ncbi:MAG TPA: HNH endonuclease, partial [Anaerolineae bacterium]|nr:HNH endonuclease [Anaerolineae bacterium]
MAISPALRQRVRQQAANRCGYCLSLQQYLPYSLEIEHLLPRSRGGNDDEDNLWLACRSCNMYKSSHIAMPDPLTGILTTLFHPRQQQWDEHFQWSIDSLRIEG